MTSLSRENVFLLRCSFIRGSISTPGALLKILPIMDSELRIVANELVVYLLAKLIGILKNCHFRTQTLDKPIEVLGTGSIQCLLDH